MLGYVQRAKICCASKFARAECRYRGRAIKQNLCVKLFSNCVVVCDGWAARIRSGYQVKFIS